MAEHTIKLNDETEAALERVRAKVARQWRVESVTVDDAIRTAIICLDAEFGFEDVAALVPGEERH